MNKHEFENLIEQYRVNIEESNLEEAAKCLEKSFEYSSPIDNVINLAFLYIDLDKFARSKELFESVLQVEENASCYYGLGNLLDKSGKREEAISYYEKAISISPEFPYVYFDCAYLYDDLKNYNKAKEYYKKAIELENDDFWSNLNLGSIYEKENDNENALHYFLEAYNIDSKKPMVNYNLGVVYSKLRNKEKSLEFYLQEAELENHYNFTYFNLGLLYKDEFKDLEKAKLAYLKGLEEDKDNYYIWYNLGCLYVAMNDYKNAYDCFIYLYYKNPKMLEYIKEDPELENFRNSLQYQKIMG